MKIAIGSDHRGYDAKERIKALLSSAGHEVIDHGADSRSSCDYPGPGLSVARDVASGAAERAVSRYQEVTFRPWSTASFCATARWGRAVG